MRIEIGDGCGFGGFGARSFADEMGLLLDLREGEWDSERIAEAGERVNPRTAGVGKAEELGDFVVGFAGGVVEGAADERVMPGELIAIGDGRGAVEVSVSAGDDEGECVFCFGAKAPLLFWGSLMYGLKPVPFIEDWLSLPGINPRGTSCAIFSACACWR